MKRIAATWLLAGVVGASSCTKTDAPASTGGSSTGPATTQAMAAQPSANAPVSGHVVKVADGIDLTQVRNQDMVHPAFSISAPDVQTPVMFADVSNDKNDTSAPVILKKTDDKWKILELTEAGDQEWVYVGVCGPRHELWGILDSSGDNGAGALTLLRSTDEGGTWQFFAAVKKPAAEGEFVSFTMAANGVGRLIVHLPDDADGVSHGYYQYQTADGGKSWTGPTLEPDDMTDADSQRDMDSLQEAIKDAEAPPAN
jgi:hypothetical protein